MDNIRIDWMDFYTEIFVKRDMNDINGYPCQNIAPPSPKQHSIIF